MSIPKSVFLADIQDSFRDIEKKIEPLRVGNINLSGRRVIGAGPAIDNFDYVTKFDLEFATTQLAQELHRVQGALSSAGLIRFGLFASRGAATTHKGELFVATDHQYVTWLSTGAVWIYLFGRDSVTQSGITGVAALLGTNDARFELEVSDFKHVLQWSGTAFAFSPEDDGSNYYLLADEAPEKGLWQACDGSTVSYLKGDGSTGSKALDNLSTAAYLKGGTAAAAVAAATGFTDDDPTTRHTHTFTTGAPSATVSVDNNGGGSTVTVATGTHTHTGTTDPGTAHHHGPGDLELRRKQMILYFRR